jgi:hypothetical protein
MGYYVMTCEGVDPMPIARGPEPEIDDNWMLGRLIDENTVPKRLTYTLDTDYGGTPKAMYEEANPVMSNDLVKVLTSAGVNNIQYFDAILVNPDSGHEYADYKAFNVVGLVAAADMTKSELMGTSDSSMGDVDFHALVLDESKARGLLLFRLAEKISAIVVHEKIKTAIEAANIPGFVFYEPGDWSG